MSKVKESRVQISKSFIDQWTQCVSDRMTNPRAKGTVQKIIEALLIRKLRDSTKHIRQNNGRSLIALTDDALFNHQDVIEALQEIMENDIEDLSAHAPIAADVTKTALEIYNEELNDPGLHFDFEEQSEADLCPQGFEFWVLDETPERASKNRQIFKQIWRDKAHELCQEEEVASSPNYPMFTKALTPVFDQFSDFNEANFFDPQNVNAVKYALFNKIDSAGPRERVCLQFLLQAYDQMLKPPVFKSGRLTQTPPTQSVRGLG